MLAALVRDIKEDFKLREDFLKLWSADDVRLRVDCLKEEKVGDFKFRRMKFLVLS
jgi:hypothetical protein